MTNDLYPSGPSAVPLELTHPTRTYKQRAWLAVSSLILFVALYLALAGWFVWTAYRLLHEAMGGGADAFVHFMVGACAAFLAVFMLKALVFVKRGSVGNDLEVTESEQPRLFAFLHRLADEAGAPRPKRVFLSARVNAAVFYDLSVLNLLFPSRKNLEIGLALVNVLTLSEFKAVLAHEFGHFAQRSMAIGRWVYIAQQIAEHVVAKRDALDKFLHVISRIDIRISWVGWIMSIIVWSIRSLMDTILRLVVLAQRALSRQMEFQADLVAVSLTGSDELVHALHKLQAADEAWGRSLNFAGAELGKGRIPHDLLAVQTQVIKKTAHIFNDESYGQVPKADGVSPESYRIFKTGFAQPPQMWSTHPASADREENAKKIYLPAPHDARSAWLLFDNVDALKANVLSRLIGETKAEQATAEQTLNALEERYGLPQYNPRYRGAYLGRALTRHVARPDQLYEAAFANPDIRQALSDLYAPSLADELAKLRELEEEKGTLKALHDKVYRATGGRIVYRGREIPRGELPEAIREVSDEEAAVRGRILAHDQQCRQAHLAAASELGGGWKEYLIGLIQLLHYGEHSLANLRDAQGYLGNVVAIVTADGKVSESELKRLLVAANSLYDVLATIHHAHKTELQLDARILARLEVASWSAMLEEFKLPPASNENINDWMRAIDGWVESAAGALSTLCTVTLEILLRTEDEIAQHFSSKLPLDAAPPPTVLPKNYSTLLSGEERKRQQRLGWWDRFQVADGMVPAIARLLVAGSIVGAVLGFGGVAAKVSTLSIYNGLGRPVVVSVGNKSVSVPQFSAREIEVEFSDQNLVEAKTTDGLVIESFSPYLSGRSPHYVYNVAGAAPLVEWAATYGSAPEQSPHFLGATRWSVSTADVYFNEPPKSVSTKSGGATRWVLAGVGDKSPEQMLRLIHNAEEEKQVILAHARWDNPDTPNASAWKSLAEGR